MNKLPFVYIENTLVCNLKCTMCSNPSEHQISALKKEEIINLLDYFSDKTEQVVFSGGESLLDQHFEEYFEHIPHNVKITLLTNGTMFDSPIFESIVGRLGELRVSIDDMVDSDISRFRLGSSPKRVAESIIKARKLNDDMIIVVTSILNESFIDRIGEFVDYFINSESDVDVIRFIPQIYYKGRAPFSIEEKNYECMDFETIATKLVPFIDSYIKNEKYKVIDIDIQHLFSSEIFDADFKLDPFRLDQKCCEYQKGLFINNNADLIFCPNSQLPILNMRATTDFDNLVGARDEALNSDKHHITDVAIAEKQDCTTCKYLALCGGGCPAITYNTTNNVALPDYTKCAFTTLWEHHILPIMPEKQKAELTAAINTNGSVPRYFKNIYEIIEHHNPSKHTEDYLH